MLELRHSYPSQLSSGPLSTLVLCPLHQKPQPLSPGGNFSIERDGGRKKPRRHHRSYSCSGLRTKLRRTGLRRNCTSHPGSRYSRNQPLGHSSTVRMLRTGTSANRCSNPGSSSRTRRSSPRRRCCCMWRRLQMDALLEPVLRRHRRSRRLRRKTLFLQAHPPSRKRRARTKAPR